VHRSVTRRLEIVGGIRERLVVTRRGRTTKLSARGASLDLLGGPSTSPVDGSGFGCAWFEKRKFVSLHNRSKQAHHLLATNNGGTMRYDEAKVDEAVLAVLYLTAWEEHGLTRAGKGIDWDASNRLHERGLIDDPKNKNKSVIFTEEGRALARASAERLFS
jgi:hypothetical protein